MKGRYFFTITLLLAICFNFVLENNLFAIPNTYHRRPASIVANVEKSGDKNLGSDKETVERLLRMYRFVNLKQASLGDSMWKQIFNLYHVPFHKVFIKGSAKEAAKILQYPGRSELFVGIDSLKQSTNAEFNNPLLGKNYAKLCLDNLIRFAEAIGAIPLDNPERYHLPPRKWSANRVIDLIEKKIGQKLHFPNPYPDEYGCATKRGIMGYRAPQSLYQAWRISELVKDIGNPRILEIGGGLGRTAYYSSFFGIQDYTVVDIPFTSLLAAYHLTKTLGKESILLPGEAFTAYRDKIKFVTPQDFINGCDSFDLIINIDSLTEMDPQIAKAYWVQIEKRTNLFLSINHEQNPFSVRELIKNSEAVKKVFRSPYWLRNGYVEELVIFKRK